VVILKTKELNVEIQSVTQSYVDHSLPKLSRAEEYKLARLAKKGDEAARNELMRSYYPFVVMLSKSYRNRFVPLEDVIQEGMMGLMKAVEMFEPSKGNRLTTYASWWIKAYTSRYTAETRTNVRIPQHSQQKFKIFAQEVSLNQTVAHDADSTYIESLESEAEEGDVIYERKEISEEVQRILKYTRYSKSARKLSKDILDMRLMSDDPCTLQEIADKHGLSRERVRQIEAEMKDKLRNRLQQFAA
jgi:RNA polymerase primary sigma factor